MQKDQTDFLLRYDFDNGSLPPPYHYEYTICIGVQGQGRISFLPDYPSSSTPLWEESFEVSREVLDELFQLLIQKNALQDRWTMEKEPVSGGEWQRLEIILDGKKYTVPGGIEHQTKEKLSPVFTFIRSLVPKGIWQGLEECRRIYEESNQMD